MMMVEEENAQQLKEVRVFPSAKSSTEGSFVLFGFAGPVQWEAAGCNLEVLKKEKGDRPDPSNGQHLDCFKRRIEKIRIFMVQRLGFTKWLSGILSMHPSRSI